MSWWSSYPKGSAGNILHFLYFVCGFDVAEHALIGSGRVEYWNKPIAAYDMDEQGFPVFRFIPQDEKYRQREIERWSEGQEKNRKEAIEDWEREQRRLNEQKQQKS